MTSTFLTVAIVAYRRAAKLLVQHRLRAPQGRPSIDPRLDRRHPDQSNRQTRKAFFGQQTVCPMQLPRLSGPSR
ncbi:MAG: hypothetical protein EWM72_01489 [Nitrospira sp.]|nr:MAG: hypothetical protein EWM72_01489 [Nitrospira sp.]